MIGGTLADRLGRRATMLLSLFGGAAAILSVGLSTSIPQIGVATFAMGWLAEMYRPAVSAMIADVVPPADRQRAYEHLYWVANLGFAIAPVLAGLAARTSYLTLFVVDAATMAAYYGMSWGVASCVGPLVGGFFLSGAGGRALWFSCFGLMALVACGHLAIGRLRERRERALAPSAPVVESRARPSWRADVPSGRAGRAAAGNGLLFEARSFIRPRRNFNACTRHLLPL